MRKISRLRYKLDGEGITTGFDHVFIVNMAGEVRQISSSASDHRCPVFFPDGGTLAFVADFTGDDDAEKSPRVIIIDLKSWNEISIDPMAKSISALVPLHEGLYYVGKEKTENSVEFDKLFRLEAGNRPRCLSREIDAPIGYHVLSDVKKSGLTPSVWATPEGDGVFFVATFRGRQQLYAFHMEDEAIREIPLSDNITAFTVGRKIDGRRQIVYTADSMTRPSEVYSALWDARNNDITGRRLTSWNEPVADILPECSIDEHVFGTPDGFSVFGWKMTPSKHAKREPVGTVLVIHGGPHFCYGYSFLYDFWHLCKLGFRVLFCNPRGSVGYGQEYAEAIIGEWGGLDVDDIKGFLREALKGEEKREEALFLMGGSYGGYLVNWLVSHGDLFQAAIAERSICNLYSKLGNSDLGFVINARELGGVDLWSDEEFIMSRSPIRYATQVNTPLLLLHGENDERCPIEQSEQWFNALKRLGKKIEYIRFPGASHTMASSGPPAQRAARLEAIALWFLRNIARKDTEL
jgi:dipeptidyl aminopeptidase/acylaminoacyl peptidase